MATIYERILRYETSTDSKGLITKTLARKISWNIYCHFKSKNSITRISRATSIEELGTFDVRNYPEEYTPTIDYIIAAEAKKKKDNLRKLSIEEALREKKQTQPAVKKSSSFDGSITGIISQPEKRNRTRKPIAKKEWTQKRSSK